MTPTRRPDGTTVLDGPVADQPAPHGLLCKVSDFGLPLVPVVPTPASGRRAWPTYRTRSTTIETT